MGEIYLQFSQLAQTSGYSLNYQRTWCQRVFGKMQSGSLRGSIFTLSATGLGAGFLAIPKVLQWSGIILGLLVISFSGLLNYFSLYIVSKCCFRFDLFHYGTMTQSILGHFWGMLVQIAIILNSVGLIIVFNIIIGNLIPSIFSSININFDKDTERVLVLVFLNIVFVLPLGLYRKLASLRYEAFFKIIILTYTLIVVITDFPFFIPQNNYQKIKYFNIDINIFNTFTSGIFAFICQQNLTRVQSELKNKSLKRMQKVNFRATLFMDILLSAMSLFGYLSLLKNIPQIIITREPPLSIQNDWAMVLARVLISISFTISMAINLITCRYSIEKLVFKVQEQSPLWLHVVVTVVLITFTLIVAIFVPSITIMISFIGGISGSVMLIIIPSLLYLSLSGARFTSWKSMTILIGAGVLSIITFISIFINLFT